MNRVPVFVIYSSLILFKKTQEVDNIANEDGFKNSVTFSPHFSWHFTKNRPVNEWLAIALANAHNASIYLGMVSSHMQNFIWQINSMPALQ